MQNEARVVVFGKGIERHFKVPEIFRDRHGNPWTCCSFPNKAGTLEDCLANLAESAQAASRSPLYHPEDFYGELPEFEASLTFDGSQA